jgi:hypothetical protein
MSVEALEMENLAMTSSAGRSKKRSHAVNRPLLDFDASHNFANNNNNVINNNNYSLKTKPSSRIRLQSKLEMIAG